MECPLLDADIISEQLYAKSGSDKERFNSKWGDHKNKVNVLESHGIANIDSILNVLLFLLMSTK